MLEKKDELRSGLPFAMECTIQEVLDKDLTKTQFSLLGLSKKKEIQLDIDLYPEFDDIEANQLEELLSTREDLKNKFQIENKIVLEVIEYKDGFMVTALDSQYHEKLMDQIKQLASDPTRPEDIQAINYLNELNGTPDWRLSDTVLQLEVPTSDKERVCEYLPKIRGIYTRSNDNGNTVISVDVSCLSVFLDALAKEKSEAESSTRPC